MKVLVPLDGSQGSECVLAYVRSLGQRQEVRVQLLHADEKNYQQAGADYLARIESQLAVRHLGSWSVVGPAREEICRVASEQKCDLIVMASHGHSGLRRWMVGSVAEGVIRTAPCPVLLLRCPAPESSRFRHILVPVDGSPASLKVHLQLAPYAGRNTRVTLLTATGLSHRDEMKQLADHLRQIRVGGVEFCVQVVHGEAAASILGWAGEEGCDLIAMASHAHNSVHQFFLGSVTQKVLRRASCSVLVFPATGFP